MEDVKVREMQIFDYKKKIAEAETKLKQQQNLYEAVRSDRNLYSKNLIESQVHKFTFVSRILVVTGYVFRNLWRHFMHIVKSSTLMLVVNMLETPNE